MLSAAVGLLRLGGLLVFTLEVLSGDQGRCFELAAPGRYRHGSDYVQETLGAAGLTTCGIERAALRNEIGAPVSGFVVTAAKV